MSDPINLDDHRRRRADIEAVEAPPSTSDNTTSFHHQLDDEPTGKPVYVDLVTRDHQVLPIIPANLRGWSNIRSTAGRIGGRWWHKSRYHAVRFPVVYAPLALFWAVVGALRLAGRAIRWWWAPELNPGKSGSIVERLSLHKEGKQTRLTRGLWLVADTLSVALAVLLAWWLAPWWLLAPLAVTVVVLAQVGKPATVRIINPAVVTPRFRALNADVVVRAYTAAKLCDPAKPGQQLEFGSRLARDSTDQGSHVLVDLPYGKGLDDAVKARPAIASGLDVALSQVFITRDPTSHRRHVLYVADRDPLAIGAGRTPLLRLQPTDIWEPAPFGLDERGRKVDVPLMWNSLLVGAQPRQGKTFSARSLALYAALDPYVKLTVFDGKGSPDWRKFALVADRCGFGLAMTRDGDPVDLFIQALREVKADVQDRYQRLSELPADVCPEGKLTRDLARNPKYKMPVRLVVIDEFQEYFDLGDASKEIAQLLVFLVKVAPAAGVIVLGATQKPSGIGTGQVKEAFTAFRDNHQIRFSLRTGSWQVSDIVLGSGAYSEGYDSSTLLPEYKGVGILRGATDATPTVRTYLADAQDAERILTVARTLRQRAGTLSGYAAGEASEPEPTFDLLADVLHVMNTADKVWNETLAVALAALRPQVYAGWQAAEVGAALSVAGVEIKQVWGTDDNGRGRNRNGVTRTAVSAAIARRQISGGP